ncbi:MAG: carboxymuconolactone decarboxylase family protein [Sphingomonadales bacterium]|nr:carboxymuconolactone decarboxylase family protein [Sphingomonadales bacterium]
MSVLTADGAAARQQQVNGGPERIAQLPRADFPPEAQAICEQVFAALGIDTPDSLAPYFAILIKHPGLFQRQMEAGITFFRGAIPMAERELAILRVAWRAGAPYEWSEHVAIAKGCGWSEADVERVIAGPEAEGWSDHQRAILRAVDELHGDTMISDATWATLSASWNEAQLLELPALVGQYLMVAMIQNSIRLPLGNDPRGLAAR